MPPVTPTVSPFQATANDTQKLTSASTMQIVSAAAERIAINSDLRRRTPTILPRARRDRTEVSGCQPGVSDRTPKRRRR